MAFRHPLSWSARILRGQTHAHTLTVSVSLTHNVEYVCVCVHVCVCVVLRPWRLAAQWNSECACDQNKVNEVFH